MRRALGLLLAGAGLMLGSCAEEPGETEAPAAKAPEAVEQANPSRGGREIIEAEGDEAPAGLPQGTPLAERVATLGLLNKRNNLTQDIEIKPGEEVVLGDVRVRLASCERTPPWENPPETGAFVQLDIKPAGSSDRRPRWARVFSGWLFRSKPSINVVEHPIYDLWVKDCAMSFPGEEAPSRSNS